jgi:hypothetical protein
MSFYDAIRVGASGAGDYEVERSLRFNDDDTAYLSRDFGSGGNRKKWTFSAWIKRGNLGGSAGEMRIFGGDTNASHIFITSNDALTWDVAAPGSSASANLTTTQLFRDVSAWFHLVCAFDTDNSTANNRMRIYINGTEVTSFGTRTNPSSGYALNAINADGDRATHTLGYRTSAQGSAGMEFDGYMAEVHFIDGQQYDASYFGETDVITGQWNPKKYVGSYGTNGFYLNFSDNSGTTATTLGKDSSGNGNNFTPNGFSVAAGAGNDSLEDTPTNNFCTLNRLHKDSNTTLSNGNLQAAGSSATDYNTNTQGTFAQSSGKWYYEAVCDSTGVSNGLSMIGWAVTTLRFSDNPTGANSAVGYRPNKGDYIDFSGNNLTGKPTTSTGTVIQIAIDFDAGKIWFGSGGTYFESGDPSAGSNEARTFTAGTELAPVVRSLSATYTFNFGQRAFSYTVPTGFKALNSANLPDPTIKLPNKHFDTLLWTGTAASHTLTGLNFQPDWFWAKARSVAYHNTLMDSVRGVDRQLWSNRSNDEQTNANFLTSFNSNGLTLGDNSSGTGATNTNGHTYVGWNWNAGDTDGKTYTVTVVDDSGNKYRFDGFGTSAVTLDLAEGGTYIFNYPSAHPFRFSTTADGTHGGGSEYTTGVTHNSSTQVTIVVAASAPQLYYYCASHSGMGGAVNTNSTLGSSNFDGSIQTTAKVNASAGFSIVTYTRNGSSITVGHGLGVAPKIYIRKRRDSTDNWIAYNTILDGSMDYLVLNATDAKVDSSLTVPTSTKFYDDGSGNMVVYAFSEVAGYSKFGSYTGNGNADGTFVFTGFRPAWVMIKNTVSGHNWHIYDSARSTSNPALVTIYANRDLDEENNTSVTPFDILSNGFKIRSTWNDTNQSGSSIIYLAFAESPFKNARAR